MVMLVNKWSFALGIHSYRRKEIHIWKYICFQSTLYLAFGSVTHVLNGLQATFIIKHQDLLI